MKKTGPRGGLAALTFASVLLLSLLSGGAAASSAHSGPGHTSSPPPLPSGVYVTFTCTHGTIRENGTAICHDQTVANYPQCGQNAYCYFSVTVTLDSTDIYLQNLSVSGAGCLGPHGNCYTAISSFPANYWFQACASRCLGYATLNAGPNVPVQVYIPTNQSCACTFASLQLNGTDYAGPEATIWLDPGYAATISAVIGLSFQGMYSFGFWSTNAGTLGNNVSATTTLTTSSSGGILDLGLNGSGGTGGPHFNPWGGYVQTGSAVTAVSGSIYLPGSLAIINSCNQLQECITSPWVGIGGYLGTRSLWQVGFEIQCVVSSGSCQDQVWPWYEYIGLGGTGIQAVYMINGTSGHHVDLGKYIGTKHYWTFEVWTVGTGTAEKDYFLMAVDGTEFWGTNFTGGPFGDDSVAPITWIPDPHSADWIVEAPNALYDAPLMSLEFFNPDVTDGSVGYSSYFAPLIYILGEDANAKAYYFPTVPPLQARGTPYAFLISTYT